MLALICMAMTCHPALASEHRDIESLRAVHDAWIAAYTSGKVDDLERFYLPDTVLMPEGRPTRRGWSEIRAFFAPGFEAYRYEAKARLETLTASGDLGAAQGVVDVTLTPKVGGAPLARTLRYLVVFKRIGPGDWRILLDADNLDPSARN